MRPREGRRPGAGQAGLSMIEMVIATFLGMIALVGILFIYRNQNKQVVVQGSIAEMRMNAQFALNEILYYLAPAGLGLPDELPALQWDATNKDLVVLTNDAKVGISGTAKVNISAALARYNLPSSTQAGYFNKNTTTLRTNKVYAVLQDNNGDYDIVNIDSVISTSPYGIILAIDGTQYPTNATIYPLTITRVHRATGVGADTLANYLYIIPNNPFVRRPRIDLDTLSLAEGIDSLGYKFYLTNGDSTTVLPTDLETLAAIGVIVRARTLLRDPTYKGYSDGYRRQLISAKVNYRRSL